jgi:hypothetical protein
MKGSMPWLGAMVKLIVDVLEFEMRLRRWRGEK